MRNYPGKFFSNLKVTEIVRYGCFIQGNFYKSKTTIKMLKGKTLPLFPENITGMVTRV